MRRRPPPPPLAHKIPMYLRPSTRAALRPRASPLVVCRYRHDGVGSNGVSGLVWRRLPQDLLGGSVRRCALKVQATPVSAACFKPFVLVVG
jgi:hypothetical protein